MKHSAESCQKILYRHPKTWSRVAPSAIFKRQITAEGSSSVVTSQTGHSARGYEMLSRRGRTHLPCLWRSRCQLMTLGTCESFSRIVISMTESVSIRARVGACRSIGFLFVTNSARRNLAARIRPAGRGVAGVTVVVRSEIRRNRQACASIYRCAVTTGTASLRTRRAVHVLCVVKTYIESFIEA